MLPNADDENTAFFDLRKEDFPIIITFFSEATGKKLHSITIEGPGAAQIPGQGFFKEPVTVTVETADGRRSNSEKGNSQKKIVAGEETESACPNCGIVATREAYDIGSGAELSCAKCEWCWGANGQDLKQIYLNLDVRCPNCGRINDSHDGSTPDLVPEDGDLSMCWGCHAVGVYVRRDSGLAIRKPTPEESKIFSELPEVQEALALVNDSLTPQQASEKRWNAMGDPQ